MIHTFRVTLLRTSEKCVIVSGMIYDKSLDAASVLSNKNHARTQMPGPVYSSVTPYKKDHHKYT